MISIAIMVRDAGPILDTFLARLALQEVEVPYEIVALYFGRHEDSFEKLRRVCTRVLRIAPDEFNFGNSRDLVCGLANGEFIVTASVDALPIDNYWLRRMTSPLIAGDADIVQGEIQCPQLGDQSYPSFFYWEQGGLFTYTRESLRFFQNHGGVWLACVNLAFRRTVWQQTGFTGVSFCEDKIFQKRVHKAGFRILFDEQAAVLHAHNYRTVRSLFERAANEGLGWRQVGEQYTFWQMLGDLSRHDLHLLTIKALLQKKLKYPSEIFFFFVRPVALYWGNNWLRKVYP